MERQAITKGKFTAWVKNILNRKGANNLIEEGRHLHSSTLVVDLINKEIIVDPHDLERFSAEIDGENFEDNNLS